MQQQTPQTSMQREVRQYIRTLSLVSVLTALAQIVVSAAAARANQATVLATQQTLISESAGGGATLAPAAQLGPMLVTTYFAGAVTCLLMLALCWYTARLMTRFTGSRRAAAAAGRRVALVTSIVWVIVVVVVGVLLPADGSLAWLLASVGALIVTPASHLTNGAGILITAPGAIFLAFHFIILLLFDIPAALAAYGLGALASWLGAGSVAQRLPPMPQTPIPGQLPQPGVPLPPDYLPYPPPPGPTYPPQYPHHPPQISG